MSQRPRRENVRQPTRYRFGFVEDEGVVPGVVAEQPVQDADEPVADDTVSEQPVAVERVAADTVVAEQGNTHQSIDNAVWGILKGKDITDAVNSAYVEVIRWRRNIFNLATGKAGEEFIDELTKLFVHFNAGDAFESVALTMASIILHLLLQKPAPLSKMDPFFEKSARL